MRRPARRPAAPLVLLAAGVPLVAAPADARGQPAAGRGGAEAPAAHASAPAPGRIAGQIVDASTGEPLPEALVVLAPHPEGLLPTAGAGASAYPAAAYRVRSDAAGRYGFAAVAPGTYRLHAARLGYAAASVDVRVADAAPEVSLGLTVAPLALRPVEVRAAGRRGPEPGAAAPDDGGAAARLAAAALRQRTYLTTDARELTRADVGEAATVAESDLFRALHRLPGVSTRDEWAAELWTRGARPDLTRVTLDGLPLYSPVAAFGAFAAVNADAVGSATLLPGVRPASVGEGGAAVLDLRTRAGGRFGGRAAGGVAGVGELGVASARLSLDGAAAGGRAAWMVSARRSYLDGVTALLPGPRQDAPDFGDLTARADVLVGGQRLVVSGLLQRSRSVPDMSPIRTGDRGVAWGNRLARVTHAAAGRGLAVTHTLGASTHSFASRGAGPAVVPFPPPGDTAPPAPVVVPQHPDVRVSAVVLRGELAPAPRGAPPAAADAAGPAWEAGYELSRQQARVAGGGRRYFTSAEPPSPEWTADDLARDSVAQDGAVTVAAAWAARRWRPSPRLEVEPGLRLDLAAGAAGGPAALRPGPRLAARYTFGGGARLSAAVGRSVQYTQALARVGLDNGARFYPGALWFAAGARAPGAPARAAFAGDVPALTTDLATFGAERWLGGGWLGAANAYARRTRGLLTYDPAPGALTDSAAAGRAAVVPGRERAVGLELSARRLVGRTTATLAYSWGASAIDAGGWRYRAPQDRPHAFDATVSHRLGARWRVGGALSAASGTPYARTVTRALVDGAGAMRVAGSVRDRPGSSRNPSFRGADLLVEWTRPVRGWHLGAFAQLHSPLAAVSSDAYRGRELCYAPEGSAPGAVFGPSARCVAAGAPRETTFPVIPVVGMRWAF